MDVTEIGSSFVTLGYNYEGDQKGYPFVFSVYPKPKKGSARVQFFQTIWAQAKWRKAK